jgi:transcriptional regulator with XRE-family HTH domain
MDLQNVRDSVEKTLAKRRLSQVEFAEKHSLSHSWLNKFLRGELDNPRFKSLERLTAAVEAERRTS